MKRIIVLVLAAALGLPLAAAALLGAHSAPAGAATDQLPDLGMAKIAAVQIQSTGGKKLLRFTTRIVNTGAGRFDAHGRRSSTADPTMSVTQRIYDSGGGSRTRPTTAQMYYAASASGDDGHNHWHLKDLEKYALTRPSSGKLVGTGAKQGFCFYDNYRFGSTADPHYTGCATNQPDALSVRVGLSRGWGDTYPWTTHGQYVDITGLADGSYRLTATADAGGWFSESSNSNNFTWADLKIQGSKVTVLRYGPSARPVSG